MLLVNKGNKGGTISYTDLRDGLYSALNKLGEKNKVLLVPPDITRVHSKSGKLTEYAWEYYGNKIKDIIPASGTHTSMSEQEIKRMFGKIPLDLFRKHDWRKDIVTLGEVPKDFVHKVSGGSLDFSWPVQLNKRVVDGDYDLILSIGQVVPHEVTGMSNYNKNILVGLGGPESINKSHYLGAVYGLEKIMGRPDNPVRKVFDYASKHFTNQLPIIYVLTVMGWNKTGGLVVRGLYIGAGPGPFYLASGLSSEVNIDLMEKPLKKVVVYLAPDEYKSTWLGNKSVYRTRMALADAGEIIVLAPGLKEFGEDKEIDRLIRKYGYSGTESIKKSVRENKDLQDNLSAAAHLIHGSSEGRFSITYCPGFLTKEEIESVNYKYSSLEKNMKKYDPYILRDGFNTMDGGEEVFYISNPALGLWSCKDKY